MREGSIVVDDLSVLLIKLVMFVFIVMIMDMGDKCWNKFLFVIFLIEF